MWKRLRRFFTNYYVLVTGGFLVWVLFFDSDDLITQVRLYKRYLNLKKEQAYYLRGIEKVQREREALTSNAEMLERFAREKYFMKKEHEEVYILVD